MYRIICGVFLFATPAFADPDGYGHMSGWGYGHGAGMILGPVLWIIVLGLVAAGVVWLVRQMDEGVSRQDKTDAIGELDLRLARGEIDTDDYAARKKLLTGE